MIIDGIGRPRRQHASEDPTRERVRTAAFRFWTPVVPLNKTSTRSAFNHLRRSRLDLSAKERHVSPPQTVNLVNRRPGFREHSPRAGKNPKRSTRSKPQEPYPRHATRGSTSHPRVTWLMKSIDARSIGGPKSACERAALLSALTTTGCLVSSSNPREI